MTLAELISAFRVDERDTVEPYQWSRLDLARWYNEAVEEAAIRKSLLRENLEFVLSAGDSEVSLPPRIIPNDCALNCADDFIMRFTFPI